MSTLLAVDTSYLYFRAFYGVPATFRSRDGRPTNAVRGTLDALARLIERYHPGCIACAWDEDWRPQWRVSLLPSYKTHRLREDGREDVADALAVQVPMIREALDSVGIPVVGVAEYEADDVLASLMRTHNGYDGIVATGDRDLFQLINDRVSLAYIARGVAKHVLFTPKAFDKAHVVPANRYVDFAVLRGDPSDGLPGVKGIGEKSAASLVAQYPSIQAMLEAAQDATSPMSRTVRAKLIAAADYLPKALSVVTCVDTLELPDVTFGTCDTARVNELSDALGLGSSLRRLADALAALR